MWGSVGPMQRRLLSGTYECSLDDRYRLAIPARVREPFAEGATIGWWLDEGLILVPTSEWSGLVERTFGAMSVLDDEARELSRFLIAGAYDHELDAQGRIPVAAELREHAGIEGRKVKLVGVGEYLEVWEPARLADRFSQMRREGVSAHAKRLAGRIA